VVYAIGSLPELGINNPGFVFADCASRFLESETGVSACAIRYTRCMDWFCANPERNNSGV